MQNTFYKKQNFRIVLQKSFDLPIYAFGTVNMRSIVIPNCDINSTNDDVRNNIRPSLCFVKDNNQGYLK